jgi:DNA polymerase/3'-5' exonuclease PolX
MDHARAERLARNIAMSLSPACDRIQVAGSVRRGKVEVKDIEIVAIPLFEPTLNLFGEEANLVSKLNSLLVVLIQEGRLAWDMEVRRNGDRHKRLKIPRYDMVLDLFIANKDNWGNILTIRTGDHEFSKILMTSRQQGGCMPWTLRQEKGYLWRGESIVSCQSEEAYFAALGIEEIPEPKTRNREMAQVLSRKLRGVSGGA